MCIYVYVHETRKGQKYKPLYKLAPEVTTAKDFTGTCLRNF